MYYGTVKEIGRHEDGTLAWLSMTSERYGEYVMQLSEDTVWIDSGRHTADDPADLQEGEGLYVFHSPVASLSLPPQSAALAVVRDVPMDAGCAWYHEVEAITEQDGQVTITTDQGNLLIFADENTQLSHYDGASEITLADLHAGDRIMAWYGAVTDSLPGQTHATHLMVLPGLAEEAEGEAADAITRGELAVMLYERAGKPEVNTDAAFADVTEDAPYAQAVAWAASQGLMNGYGNGSFGPERDLTREQLAMVLWNEAGRPMLMDYPGLTQYPDAGEISRYAQSAVAWAHQQGILSAMENGPWRPRAL